MLLRKKIGFLAITVMCIHAHAAGGWNTTVNNSFTKSTDLTKWEFTIPWHGYGQTTDYTIQDGYIEIKMLSTDKGGVILSPRFYITGDIRITVEHYMHKAGGNYLGGIKILNETADPKKYPTQLDSINITFQNSSYSPDYACATYNIPVVSDKLGCTPKTFQSTTATSSSLFDQWVTTIINYSPKTGKITIDYDNDGIIDFIGTLAKEARFIPTRIGFSGYGWYTGHFYRISNVTVESTN